MSFAPEFTPRWKTVLQPALRRISVNSVPLSPFRVDLSKASDAILTEILEAISDSAVVVADVTALGTLGDRAVRNANVLYEVGIAHACRRPEEVVLFRSDRLPLDFDVQGVRVHNYSPDEDSKTAEGVVVETVLESLRSAESARTVAVRVAAKRLTLAAYSLLLEAHQGGAIRHPSMRTMGEVLSGFERTGAIELLLELGAIEARPLSVTSELLDRAEQQADAEHPWLDYALSAFGKALALHVLEKMLPKDPRLIARMAKVFGKGQGPSQ